MNYEKRSVPMLGFEAMKRNYKKIVCIIITISCLITWVWIYKTVSIFSSIDSEVFLENEYGKLLTENKLPNISAKVYPKFCTAAEEVDTLVIITSYVRHVELRSAHRRAMPSDYLKRLNVSRVFLVAQIPEKDSEITQAAIENESQRFGDMLQGEFMESYRNLTLKHLMGLNWASSCKAQYIIKIDDDIVFDLVSILDVLKKYRSYNVNSFLYGYILSNMRPSRNRANKWFVSQSEYPGELYPPFLSGWLYITTPMTAKKLVESSKSHSHFWIDDLYITGILAQKEDIKLIDMKKEKLWLEYYELLQCCLNDMRSKNIYCEYAVGPNGGNNVLIVEFTNELRKCHEAKDCGSRVNVTGKSLQQSCVVSKSNIALGRGVPEIEPVEFK